MLAVLDSICNRIENKKAVGTTDLVRIVEFITAYADECHHGKEEDLLFKLCEKSGMKEIQPLVDELTAEHTIARSLVLSMGDEITAMVNGASPMTTDFVLFARSFVLLLSPHICKEDSILYPAVDRLLTSEQQRDLLREFENVQLERCTSEIHAESTKLVQDLTTAYGATERIIHLCESKTPKPS